MAPGERPEKKSSEKSVFFLKNNVRKYEKFNIISGNPVVMCKSNV